MVHIEYEISVIVVKGVALKVFVRLQKWVKNLITWRGSKHGNFICDSRPWICISCVRLRWLLMHGHLPNYIKLATKHGWYFHMSKQLELIPLVEKKVVLTPILGGGGQLSVLQKGKFHILNPMVKK